MNLLEAKFPKDKDGGFYSLMYSKALAQHKHSGNIC